MKKSILLVFSMFVLVLAHAQNLTVSSWVGTPVENILQQHLAGEGVLLSGCPYPDINSSFEPGKFNGQQGNVQSAQIGTFNRNASSFPFQTGIIMTTGNVSVAEGPNSGGSCSSTTGVVSYTDQDLSSMMSNLQHCAALEFDFVASADTFAFNYIFASEEYPEYACSSFNDVFAFFLSGIDPVTIMPFSNRNVAIIPGTVTSSNPNGVPVSINSVNAGPGASGSSSGCVGTSGQYSSFYVGNPSGVEYDGHTVALTAAATILACQKYHVKMAIGNGGDNAYDSGVFLEEGSLHSPQMQIEQQWSDTIGGDTLIQNFREMDLLFKLPRPALTGNTDVIIHTSGDAVLGQDYSLTMPDGMEVTPTINSFTIPPGDATIPVHMEILPTAQFPEDMPVKTAILEVISQGCAATQYAGAFSPHRDTIVLHLRDIDSVALPDRSLSGDLMVFPNPASDVINLQSTMNKEQLEVLSVEVFDVYGKLVAGVETVHAPSLQMDVSNLPPGMFTLKVTLSDGSVTMQKMVKR